MEDPLMRKIRYLDKLVDELAKGKAMGRVLRTQSIIFSRYSLLHFDDFRPAVGYDAHLEGLIVYCYSLQEGGL